MKRCARPRCRKPLPPKKPGRPRLYCGATCRSAVYWKRRDAREASLTLPEERAKVSHEILEHLGRESSGPSLRPVEFGFGYLETEGA